MRIELPSGTPAELAEPVGDPIRGLVIAPDVNGLRPLFDEMCARLARDARWLIAAVEPYPGQADLALDQRLAGPIDHERVRADQLAAADLLRGRGVDRVGILGFCQGGMNVFRAAGTGAFDRAVAFYGMIRPPEAWRWKGHDPLDELARDDVCPTLAILGGADRWTPPDDIEALRGVGAHVTVRVYDGADHGFVHDPSRPAHRPDDAADAWRWATEFLA
jgi:carboxymethylenebutenolidase